MVRDQVTAEDLPLINKALADGADVRIQGTNDGGFRIVADRVKLLKRSAPRKTAQHVPDYPKIQD